MIQIDYEPNELINDEILELIKNAIHMSWKMENCPYPIDVYVELVDEATIKGINNQTRDQNKVTDVLSFPMLEYDAPGQFPDLENDETAFDLDTGNLYLGDVVLCLPRALEQAEEYGHSIRREIGFLMVHSILHLFGYDHSTEEEEVVMRHHQNQILTEIGLIR